MTTRGKGSKQRDIIVVLETFGPTLSSPVICAHVARRHDLPVTASLQKQLRKSLDALCVPGPHGEPPPVLKARRGKINYFTLAVHKLSHEMISAEDRELATRYQRNAALALLGPGDELAMIKREFLTAVAIQTWRRVKCQSGETIHAAETAAGIRWYLVTKTGMSPDAVLSYVQAEAERIVAGRSWVPLELVR